ncbi:MAG: VWA domain-containing protein [Candidatus Riflebacteria bacterium]|nr:VWA domain-containing protein [Candidatus Riflebacteria bacterium]
MLSEPHWLILLIPLLSLVILFKPESKILFTLRILLVIIIIIALSGPIMKISGKEGVVVVVADISASMPDDIDKRIQEISSILLNDMPINSRLALVSFTDKAKIEFSPTKNNISDLSMKQNADASNLSEGIDLALSMIPDGMSSRIIVVSDGLWNGQNPQLYATIAANRNIPIDFRYIGREIVRDLAVSYFSVPPILEPHEAFLLRAGVYSPIEQEANIELLLGDKSLLKTKYHLKSGMNEISFNMKAPPSSMGKYIFKVFSSGEDSQLKNNVAQSVCLIKGRKPILIISESNNSTMKQFLMNNKVMIDVKKPNEFHWQIEELTGYSAVILENVSADHIGFSGMHSLAAWVKHMGGGLLITGGKNSYGNGGYHKSPLEEALPVSLEMRSQTRKMSIAIAVVLDRSGSMGMQVSGRTKMELANLGAASSLDLLMDDDEFGVFAVDTKPHEIVPLQNVKSKNEWRDSILSIQSLGGGIYVYEGINAAVEMLKRAKSKTRHIILFADASDSEQPGNYWQLLGEAQSYGMTLSVIGLGKETDCDGELLKKIADAGKGRCFFTDEPEDLPRLFSQDTFIAAKSTFVEEKVDILSSHEMNTYIGSNLSFKSSLDAYNICYLKPDASDIITASDDDHSPILAVWQYGLGKVACFTGVLSQELGGEFLKGENATKVFNGLCKWIAFDDRESINDIVVSQKVSNGRWEASLNLDPERVRDPFSDVPVFEILRSFNDGQPKHLTMKASWDNADRLTASCDLVGNEVLVPLLKINDKQNLRLAPACQMYSPEFLPQTNRSGSSELKQLAKITGGNELIDLSSVWASMPMVYQDKNVSNFFFAFALILFLLEISERRMAILTIVLSNLKNLNKKRISVIEKKEVSDTTIPEGVTITKTSESIVPSSSNEEKHEEKPSLEKSSMLSALRTAKKKADRRNS